MYLEGKVQTARISNFGDLEAVVTDRLVTKAMGGRPQYSIRIIRGWQGLEDLRALKKQQRANQISQQDVLDFAAQIPLPQEDEVLPLNVVDIIGKQGFKTLLCEVSNVQP
jgi:hypothetical protein